jgi:hypothetical protein
MGHLIRIFILLLVSCLGIQAQTPFSLAIFPHNEELVLKMKGSRLTLIGHSHKLTENYVEFISDGTYRRIDTSTIEWWDFKARFSFHELSFYDSVSHIQSVYKPDREISYETLSSERNNGRVLGFYNNLILIEDSIYGKDELGKVVMNKNLKAKRAFSLGLPFAFLPLLSANLYPKGMPLGFAIFSYYMVAGTIVYVFTQPEREFIMRQTRIDK